MGTSYSAISGFGIVLDTGKIAPDEMKTINSCEHSERIGQPFCPKCGKAVKSYEQRYTSSELTGKLWEARVPKGYICATNGQGGDVWFIGWGSQIDKYDDDGYEIRPIRVPDTAEILATIRDILVGVETELRREGEDIEIVFDPETYGYYSFMQAL
jgi:hypothetical protein